MQDLSLDSLDRGDINLLQLSEWKRTGERGFGCRPIEDVIAGLRLIKGEWNVLLPKLDALQLMVTIWTGSLDNSGKKSFGRA